MAMLHATAICAMLAPFFFESSSTLHAAAAQHTATA